MKLKIEKWVEKLEPFGEEAMELFNESVKCYKIGAYKSAYIMSYLAFQLTVRERIINSKYLPKNMPQEQWNNHIKRLQNDDKWEEEVRNIICISPPNNNKGNKNPKDNRIIKFINHEEITNEYIKWKNTRNKCVHSKKGTIDNSTIECFWNFIKDNIKEFYVGGGIKALKQSIVDSFDISKSSENYDYGLIINHIEQLKNQDELEWVFSEIDDKYMQLSDYRIKENYYEFYRFLTYSHVEYVRDALLKYLNKKNSMCVRFIRFYNDYNHFIESILCDTSYIKRLFNEYREKFKYTGYSDRWTILKIISKNKLISKQEYDIFYRTILKNDTIHKILNVNDDNIIELLRETGCFKILSNEIHNINFKDFDIANDNEKLIHCAVRYCDVDSSLYEDVEYLIKQRGGKGQSTLYNGIVNYLNTSEGKQKYKDYEKLNNKNYLINYFGW